MSDVRAEQDLLPAVEFLVGSGVSGAPLSQRIAYLEARNYSEKEIADALQLADSVRRSPVATSPVLGGYAPEQCVRQRVARCVPGAPHAGGYCVEDSGQYVVRGSREGSKGVRGGPPSSLQWRGQLGGRVAPSTKVYNTGVLHADSVGSMLGRAGSPLAGPLSPPFRPTEVKQRWRPPPAPGYLHVQECAPLVYTTAPKCRPEYVIPATTGVHAPLPWRPQSVRAQYGYTGYNYSPGTDPEPKPPNSGTAYAPGGLAEACAIDDRGSGSATNINLVEHEDALKAGYPRHARRREAKRQRKATTMPPHTDGAENKPEEEDALPWFKTIASGRVQKHLMRFLNNFIVSKDLEDELGLHVADVFYHNSESESGPMMAALYEKLEQRVAERCPDRLMEFRKEALESLTALMAACEEREEQQEKGREALKNAGHRGKPVRNAAKRLGKSRTEARKLAAMVAHYSSLSIDGDEGGRPPSTQSMQQQQQPPPDTHTYTHTHMPHVQQPEYEDDDDDDAAAHTHTHTHTYPYTHTDTQSVSAPGGVRGGDAGMGVAGLGGLDESWLDSIVGPVYDSEYTHAHVRQTRRGEGRGEKGFERGCVEGVGAPGFTTHPFTRDVFNNNNNNSSSSSGSRHNTPHATSFAPITNTNTEARRISPSYAHSPPYTRS